MFFGFLLQGELLVFDLTTALIVAGAGALISLVLEYFGPFGVASWFEQKGKKYKRLINAGAMLVVALVVLGLECAGLAEVGGISCNYQGVFDVLVLWGAGLFGNMTTHNYFKKDKG